MAENVPFKWSHEMDRDGWSIPEQSKSIEALFTFANNHYENKNYIEALHYYGVILERAKEEADNQADDNAVYAFMKSLYMISRCHMEMGNYEEAFNIVENVCKMVFSNCPDKVHIPEQLMIELKERRGDIIGAFILALIFKQLHPSNPQCGKLLSNIQGKVEESFTKSVVINNTFVILMKKGKKLYKNDEYSTAAAFFEKVIEILHFFPDENLQKAYIWAAQCFMMMGNLDEAKSKVEKVLVRFPSNSKARKLYENIEKAKQAKTQDENASHLPDHSKGKQHKENMNKINDKKNEVKMVADHKPGDSSGNVLQKQVTAKTQGPRQSSNQPSRSATKSTDSVDVPSVNQPSRSAANSVRTGNRHNAMNYSTDTAWEGLPKPATVNTKKPRQSSNQPSPSSTNATVNTQRPCQRSNTPSPSSANRYSVLRSFSNDDSKVTQNNSAKSPVVKNGIATHDSGKSKAEDRNLEQSGPPSSDESNEGSFQTVKARKQRANNRVTERKPFCLPEGVEVICEHFEREVFAHPQNNSKIPKVCPICQRCPSKCKYAYWSKEQKKWISVRCVPSILRPTGRQILSCHHVQSGKTCFQSCTFAHGPEKQMWDLERKGDLPSPETYLKNRTVSLNNLVTSGSSKGDAAPDNVERPKGCKTEQILGRQYAFNQRLANEVQVGSNRTPIQTSRVQSFSASKICRLPMGVKIVCDDFIRKFKSYRGRAVEQATNVCDSCKKKCQERHPSLHLLIRYAFWSEGFKQWFAIRTYPRGVLRVAFRKCKDFENNRLCTRPECTFAHGPEVSMWTMEREGTLLQAWEALFRQIVYVSTNELMFVVRPLPHGALKGDLKLCLSVQSRIICKFGRGCRFAHSETELNSWKKLFEDRRKEVQTRPDNKQSLKHHELQFTDFIPGVELICNPVVPNVQLAEDCEDHSYRWEFCARFEIKLGLPAADLLNLPHNFHFTKVQVVGFDRNNKATIILSKELIMKETHIPRETLVFDSQMQKIEFRVSVAFQASLFGSFSQRLLFNFGQQPFLKKDFNIDIGSKETLKKLAARRKTVILDAIPWEDKNMTLVRFEPDPEKEKLMSTYSLPKDAERIVSAQLVKGEVRQDTYKQTMHQLLFAEEIHMRKLLLSLAPTTAVKLEIVTTKPDLRFGGIKFAGTGRLFGKIELENIEITLDDMAGRVCLRNVQHIWIQSSDKPKCLYELPSEIHEGNTIYVDLAPNVCKDLKLIKEKVVDVEMRFNLNRYILCMMHKAVDSLGITQARQLFPVEQRVIRRREVTDFFGWFLDQRLNECQKRVIHAIADVVPPSPPLVVFGPFGTGKTFTLNQAVIYLMKEKTNRVLVCTHTNSAADIHVERLDEYIQGNGKLSRAAKPLRIYSPETEWSRTSDVSRKYALVKDGVFVMPTRKNVVDHRVVITTLTTADLLTKLNVHHGFFTHILIDEAAQAWETEALIPLSLAGPNTKIVFTGDHMQMSPEVYSEFARQCGLQKSLPERLFDHYQAKDSKDDQVLFLFENYRSHEEILNFPSVNCYEKGIVAKGNIPCHPEIPPLVFYAAKGKDEKQSNNSFLNESEVYEVEKRVVELVENWPACWGRKNLQDIAVVAPYKYQVDAIRGELRKKRMSEVNVQTIHNIQGREFRALFISTVRTWNSIKDLSQSDKLSCDDLSLEFLSDPKLLITAVTRAKSLVAVVGDPFALCTLGRCKILWDDYITRCYNLNGLFGITWEALSEDIGAHFSQIQLDPEAPTFVPKSEIPRNDDGDEANMEFPNNTAPNLSELEPETEEDQASSCSGDIKYNTEDDDCFADVEDDLEDEAVLPVNIDGIIKELCKFVKKRQQQTAVMDEEFPALGKCSSKVKETQIIWPSKRPTQDFDRKTLKSEYLIRNKNGRAEIQLLDIYKSPSDRVQQIAMNNYKHQNLEPEILINMLEKEPLKFYSGQLQIRNEKTRTAYLVIPDKDKPDIQVKGSIRHAFDHDTIVVEVQPNQDETESINCGFLKGVLNHMMSPRERQYVCKVTLKNPAVMVPINRSVTKIVNLSDKSLRDIPVYKKRKTQDESVGRPMNMIAIEEVIEKKLLFVVEFLQWRSDCTLPLGIAVRTMPTGETAEQCKEILFAECGIRKAFSRKTKEMIHKRFPTTWKIPDSEMKNRKKIDKAFTIDPPEAKDMDDAISIDEIGDGKFKVGIHIADVSFFVQRGTDLDREARQRGVSYYPGQDGEENIPMLPRELSENILSLLPNEDRLTVSVFVSLNSEGEVVGQKEILRTVTRSRCRLSYSQAQQILDMEVHDNVEGVPAEVPPAIKRLHSLVVKRRCHRLKEASFEDSNNGEDADAHELIEELMILANHTVGDLLHSRNPMGTPFRTQLEPKVHRLNEWAERYGLLAKYSPALQPKLQSEDIKKEIKERINTEEKEIDIHEHTWDEICRASESGDLRRVKRLICDPLSSPQLTIARLHFMRIQTKSQYTCSGGNAEHYSLGLSNYVHFTSPIRRYVDIELHRLLIALIPSNGVEQATLNEDEMATLCRRSTYFKSNSDKFEKEFKRIHFASTLKQKNKSGMFFIDQLEGRFFTIHPVSPDHDYFLGKHKKVNFDILLPSSKSDSIDGKPETTLKWRSRIYLAHSTEADDLSLSRGDAAKIKNLLDSGRNRVAVQRINGCTWKCIIDAIKDGKPVDELLRQVQRTDENLKESATQKRPFTAGSSSRNVYKHPNFGRMDVGTNSNSDCHFHEITMNLKQCDMVHFQMFSRLHSKMLCPDVQLLSVSSGFCICLEHQRYPRRCFAFDTKRSASKAEYYSIDEYVNFWKPVLALEAANAAVVQNDGFILKSLPVKWKQKDGDIKGKFTLTISYCKSRQLEFHYGDLVCIRIPFSDDLLPEDAEATTDDQEVSIWVGHCVIEAVKPTKNQNATSVTVRLHQMACEFPRHLLTKGKRECDMEYIYQPLPLRRMITALECKLKDSSELVKTICLGQSPSQERFPLPEQELSLSDHYRTSRFKPLNDYQKNAVRQALSRPFSLIQGPPGTGKTVTGVHVAYWFAKQNEKQKPAEKQNKKSKKKAASIKTDHDKDEKEKGPPQVLYCGPSNKSVDVVTEYLLKIPGMKGKILRVHGTLIEESEYPIPNKINVSKPTASDDELKIPEGEVKEVSLHHFIRSELSPYATKLREKEEDFKELRKRKERPSEEEVAEYCKIIDVAEEWAIRESGKEIILCTCSRAGSKTITEFCDNIQQCIIDECGMCTEPEALVPMTSSNAKQFVLIGDHKQLQPIITDKRAKSLQLDISIFERLAKQAYMLRIQYRMHPSICEFPSKQFYEGMLQTSGIVTSRNTANLQIWPALGTRVCFCHIEGVEESSVISTVDSGADSKYNMDEARKAVHLAKYLVNSHRQQIKEKNVVILTPYRQQRKVIQDLLKNTGKDILVTTIIKSQGSEWDYVILSLVRSLPEQELEPEPSSSWLGEHLGFISDEHQINVALTRAKHGLFIIGNKNLLSYDPIWHSLIQHCEEKKCIVSKEWPQ